MPRFIAPPPAGELRTLFLSEGLTTLEIGTKYRVGTTLVRKWLSNCGIKLQVGGNRCPEWELTTEKEKQIVDAYRSGASLRDLIKQFRMKHGRIRSILEQNGSGIRMLRGNLKGIRAQDGILAAHRSGKSRRELADRFGLTPNGVRNVLKRNDIDLNVDGRCRTANVHAFDKLTPEAAYWIGFIMADGNVYKNQIKIALQNGDVSQIRKFAEFVGFTGTIGYDEARNQCRIAFMAPRISARLAEFGIVPRKSHDAKVIGLENNRDFWRGAVDGDGSVGWTSDGYPSILLVGSNQLLNQFREYTLTVCPTIGATVRPHSTIFSFRVTGTNAVKLIEALYLDCSVSLDRKQSNATKIISKYSH